MVGQRLQRMPRQGVLIIGEWKATRRGDVEEME